MKLVWTPIAKESYNEIEEFLLIRWNLKVTQDFIISVRQTMQILKDNPHCFQKWRHDNSYFKGIINSKISFFYKIESDVIVVFLFWNNLQNPQSLENKLK
jgi:plasmid stabilization system protein ParE